jgi:uncharacterized protein YjiS (DUF1127 family)
MSNSPVPICRCHLLRPSPPSWRELFPLSIAALFATLRLWTARRHERQELHDLAERGEDHLLEDIGMTRDDALRIAAKWFWQP